MLPKHALYQAELYPEKKEIILYRFFRKKASGNGKKDAGKRAPRLAEKIRTSEKAGRSGFFFFTGGFAGDGQDDG